jgi:hypothetical protein
MSEKRILVYTLVLAVGITAVAIYVVSNQDADVWGYLLFTFIMVMMWVNAFQAIRETRRKNGEARRPPRSR